MERKRLPSGLVRDEIPLRARIVAAADVFDALPQVRPYKRAWPVEEAVEKIQRLSGQQFDPQVVAAFLQLDSLRLARGTTRRRLTAVA